MITIKMTAEDFKKVLEKVDARIEVVQPKQETGGLVNGQCINGGAVAADNYSVAFGTCTEGKRNASVGIGCPTMAIGDYTVAANIGTKA